MKNKFTGIEQAEHKQTQRQEYIAVRRRQAGSLTQIYSQTLLDFVWDRLKFNLMFLQVFSHFSPYNNHPASSYQIFTHKITASDFCN